MNKPFNNAMAGIKRQPALVAENGIYKPLRLDLQFFAEKGKEEKDEPEEDLDDKGGAGEDSKKKETDPNGEKSEEEKIEDSLKDLLKKNPKLKEQYTEKFQADFQKRLKGLNLEEARKAVALLEKLGLNADGKEAGEEGGGAENKGAEKTSKLEQKTKDLSFKLYAAKEGYDAELISELASKKIAKLDLNEDGELDPDDLDEIIEDLEKRFPQIFDKKSDEKPDKKGSSYTPGGRQKTNPEPSKPDARKKVEERLNRTRFKNKNKKTD